MTLAHYLFLSSALFVIGLFGALTRRNVIGILMSIELMFNAANINFVAFNRYLVPHAHGVLGQAFTIFNITIAAAEIVVGLALVLSIYRKISTVYAEDYNLLRG
ncbi:MAG: NADH-quinone oxidoreductase subunit NuoK [Elusimicrobia bacterium]|nr:NADH-quinone oxidoreductase subunit NuoK [Elusimicrobiota bacterium]